MLQGINIKDEKQRITLKIVKKLMLVRVVLERVQDRNEINPAYPKRIPSYLMSLREVFENYAYKVCKQESN